MQRAALYPVFLDLNGVQVLVVGGGPVAERKVRRLVEAGARVRLVSPEATPWLDAAAGAGRIVWSRARFDEAEPVCARLVFAATNDPAANRAAAAAARRAGAWVNVADTAVPADFELPAELQTQTYQLAIATRAGVPAFARFLRRYWQERLEPWLDDLAELLAELRRELKREVDTARARTDALRRVVDSPVPDLLRAGRRDEALREARRLAGLAKSP